MLAMLHQMLRSKTIFQGSMGWGKTGNFLGVNGLTHTDILFLLLSALQKQDDFRREFYEPFKKHVTRDKTMAYVGGPSFRRRPWPFGERRSRNIWYPASEKYIPPCLTRLDAPDFRYSTNLFPISHISKMHFSYPARGISYVLSFLPFLPATAISDFFCIYGRGRAKLVLVWKYFRFLFSNSHPLPKGNFTVIYQNALCKNTCVQLGSNLFDKINSLLTEVQCNGWMVA